MTADKKAGKKKTRKEVGKDTELDLLFKDMLRQKREDREEDEASEEGAGQEGLEEAAGINIRTIDFTQIHIPETGSSPSLERMAISAPRPIFVGGIPQGPIDTGEGNGGNDPFKYVPGNTNADEPKYIASQEGIRGTMTTVNERTLGRKREGFSMQAQEAFAERSTEQSFQSQNIEHTERVSRFESENAGRRDSFGREEEKYERYKPKLPKS